MLLTKLAHQIAMGEGEGTFVIEPRMLAYALASQEPSVTTDETRLLKEEAYKCPSRRSTTVTRG